MQQRTVVLFLFALLFGGFAAFVAYQRSEKSAALAAANTKLAVVAAFDIDYGTKIAPEMVKQVAWPVGSLPEGVYTQTTDAIGKVAAAAIAKGEPITARRAVESLAGSTLASLIEAGKRAMTIRVNDVIGVAGFLLPGNRVDVLATPRPIGGNQQPKTETIVENLKVLAVDQQARINQEDPVIVRAVTVEVTPAEAEVIVQATNAGEVQLVLRNPLEEVTEKPAPAPPAPEAAPKKVSKKKAETKGEEPPPQTVTVIRGVDPEKVPVKY